MNSNSPIISVVSPIYKGEKMVNELVDRIVGSVTTITNNYEIIFVNDVLPDKLWDEKIWHKECEYNGRKIMVWGM